jgi:hypothetical protein
MEARQKAQRYFEGTAAPQIPSEIASGFAALSTTDPVR